jgi:macrolide-specific efflux system membrane fusion protein
MAAAGGRKRLQPIRRHPWLSVLIVLAVAGGAYWLLTNSADNASRPLLATVEVGDIENAVIAAGFLQPSNYVDVGAQVSGQLEVLHVTVGNAVEEGQLLAEIDAAVQANRVDASRASLRGLEAQLFAREASLRLAEANAQRQTRLMEDAATTQADFDAAANALASAQSDLTQLRSQIEQSKAGLASDEAQLGYTRIFAPSAGTVVSINMKEGQTLNANQSTPIILRIADLTTMTVEAQVSEADVTKIRRGMEVYFTTLGGGGRRWYSSLRQILPTPVVTNNVVLYTALFDISNADETLFSNMTAQIFFVTSAARNVLKVPVGALTYAKGAGRPTSAAASFASGNARRAAGSGRAAGSPPAAGGQGAVATVQVKVGDNAFEAREVRIGVTSRIAAEVLSGLQEGDQVVAGIIQSNAPAAQPAQRPFNLR